MSDIKVLRAIELVRQRPEMFFGADGPTMPQLISMVLQDVGGLPSVKSGVWRDGAFAMVCADVDWMATERAPLEHLFERFVLPTPVRVNGCRSEVLIAAVSDAFAVRGQPSFSQGMTAADAPSEMVKRAANAARALIWKFTERASA